MLAGVLFMLMLLCLLGIFLAPTVGVVLITTKHKRQAVIAFLATPAFVTMSMVLSFLSFAAR